MRHLLPEGWERPRGYSNGVLAKGEHIFVAGMIGWNNKGQFAEGFVNQFALVLENTVAVLAAADASPEHVVRMTWYIKGLDQYRENLREVGLTYRRIMGKNYPAMAVVGVSDLVEPDALIEIETTAVIDYSAE